MEKNPKYTLTQLEDLLSKESWTVSEMQPGESYEYIIKGATKMPVDAFDSFLSLLNSSDGFASLRLNGYDYMVIGEIEDTSVLYRQKTEE